MDLSLPIEPPLPPKMIKSKGGGPPVIHIVRALSFVGSVQATEGRAGLQMHLHNSQDSRVTNCRRFLSVSLLLFLSLCVCLSPLGVPFTSPCTYKATNSEDCCTCECVRVCLRVCACAFVLVLFIVDSCHSMECTTVCLTVVQSSGGSKNKKANTKHQRKLAARAKVPALPVSARSAPYCILVDPVALSRSFVCTFFCST